MSSTVALRYPWCQFEQVRGRAALAAFAMISAAPEVCATAPIYDPMTLNIGINCQWQPRCQRQQTKAMDDARKFIAAYDVPLWRIHVCTRTHAGDQRGSTGSDSIPASEIHSSSLHRRQDAAAEVRLERRPKPLVRPPVRARFDSDDHLVERGAVHLTR